MMQRDRNFFETLSCRNETVPFDQPGHPTEEVAIMYFPGPAQLHPLQTLSEEELMQSPGIKGIAIRLGVAFAAFAVLILSLSGACDKRQLQPQTTAADHVEAEPSGPPY
jgi:hypothetical protein